jgi:D-sedoheptulose 7-phosphate isomerase
MTLVASNPVSAHLEALVARAPELAPLRTDIADAFVMLEETLSQGGKLLLCGNGGSAADADHWAGELLKGFKHLRPLPVPARAGLPAPLAAALQGALPAIPLTGFPALASAFGNDVEPEFVYAQLTHALGKPGDVWIGLSTSGNAANVCAAAQVARARGLSTLGLTGASGGKLAPLCDLCLRVPATETYRVQELHLPIYHCLSLMLEDAFFAERTGSDRNAPG